jgi:phospho-N-acetylmuramoyl-pentapeptide-transferase
MTELISPILVAFVIAVISGPIIIPMLKRLKFGQVVREDGPQSHLSKTGIPTMGGFIMLIAATAAIFIFSNGIDYNVILFIVAFIGFGLIGFLDDFIKVVLKRSKGLNAKQKAALILLLSLVLAFFIYKNVGGQLRLPFSDKTWDIGWWIIPLSAFVLLSTTNSANLTDGQDGLLGGINLVYFAAYALIFAFAADGYSGNLVVVSAAMAGASLGFLVFNSHPAKVFMGDTGSLALGGAMGIIALLSGTTIWVPFMALMTVASSVSVIIQVGYYKRTKKRVFKMAPLHHHFELLGHPEIKITAMYIIITTVMCLIGILAIR